MNAPAPAAPDAPGARLGQVLLALIVSQLGIHSAMAGLRMATPLDALGGGATPLVVGLLLALFAIGPVLLALHAGRMADRLGYHRPLRLAVFASVAGTALAALGSLTTGTPRLVLLAVAALTSGAATNLGVIVMQRTAAVMARGGVDRIRVFSWLAVAPSLANVIGPVLTGLMIDGAGFGWAYAMLTLLPLVGLASARHVPLVEPRPASGPPRPAWDLLGTPGLKRLLLINWLLATCWDVHSLAIPLLGHGRGFSATTIGLVLGSFTLSVTLIRLIVPLIAQRLDEAWTLRAAMLGTGLVYAWYPLAHAAWAMVACALCLGLALGVVQPLILNRLHLLTPEDRHGEALALRSMAINATSGAMPLVLGALGAAIGAGALFWIAGAAVSLGAAAVRRS